MVKITFVFLDKVSERQSVAFPSSLFVEIIGIERIGFADFFFNHNTTLFDGKNTKFQNCLMKKTICLNGSVPMHL